MRLNWWVFFCLHEGASVMSIVFSVCVFWTEESTRRQSSKPPWDSIISGHLASHPSALRQSPTTVWSGCPTHCTFQDRTVVVIVVAFFSPPHCQGPSVYPSPAANVSTLSQRSPNETRQPISVCTGSSMHKIRPNISWLKRRERFSWSVASL